MFDADAPPSSRCRAVRDAIEKIPQLLRPEKVRAKKKSARKALYALHSWLGFHLALIMAVVLLTGTIATISNEIDWLIQHDMRVAPDGEMVSWGEMAVAIRDHAPEKSMLSLRSMGNDHFAYRARVVDEYGGASFLHVNQWTGEVTGETHPLTVQRFFRDLHRYLFLPGSIALPLVTSLAFVLAVSLYTGLKTTRNWKTVMFRIRLNKGARIFVGDVHKASGIWGVWFIVIMIVTGVWYLVEYGAHRTGAIQTSVERYESWPRLSEARIAAFGPVIRDGDLNEAIATAKAAYPELRITFVSFPFSLNAPLTVGGKTANPFARDGANGVYLDPVTLEVLKVRKWEKFSTFFALNEMADPLHFGDFGGLPTKILYFVFGLGLTGLSVTGVWLTWKRLKTSAPSKAQFATMPVLLASMYFGAQWYERWQGPEIPDIEHAFAAQTLPGNVSARLHMALNETGEPAGLLRLTLTSPDGRPTVTKISAHIDEENHTNPVRGRMGTAQTRFEIDPALLSGLSDVAFTFTYHDGTDKILTWNLSDT